jgi:hypothetical protein
MAIHATNGEMLADAEAPFAKGASHEHPTHPVKASQPTTDRVRAWCGIEPT